MYSAYYFKTLCVLFFFIPFVTFANYTYSTNRVSATTLSQKPKQYKSAKEARRAELRGETNSIDYSTNAERIGKYTQDGTSDGIALEATAVVDSATPSKPNNNKEVVDVQDNKEVVDVQDNKETDKSIDYSTNAVYVPGGMDKYTEGITRDDIENGLVDEYRQRKKHEEFINNLPTYICIGIILLLLVAFIVFSID